MSGRGDPFSRRLTNWEAGRRLFDATGVYVPTRVYPRVPIENAFADRKAVILGGIPHEAQVAVGYHENAHAFWKDFATPREDSVAKEYRADATAGYWTVWAGYEEGQRAAFRSLMAEFGANQGDHGTAKGRVAAFNAGVAAARAEIRSGAEAPTGRRLDSALQRLGISPIVSYARALRMNRATNAAMIGAALTLGRW